jgi:hypothetical protein
LPQRRRATQSQKSSPFEEPLYPETNSLAEMSYVSSIRSGIVSRIIFSQLYAKVSIPDIYLVPLQANKAGEYQGVSFKFNDTFIKMGKEFDARENTRLKNNCSEIKHYSNTGPVEIMSASAAIENLILSAHWAMAHAGCVYLSWPRKI